MFKYKITHYLKVKFKHAKSDQPTGGTSVSPSDTENDGLGSLLGFCFGSPLYAALCSTTYTVTESHHQTKSTENMWQVRHQHLITQ